MDPEVKARILEDINNNIGIVHKICRVYFPYDQEERGDLFQEILYQLWRSYSSFDGRSKFSTWMYRVALNTAVTSVRRASRRPRGEPIHERHAEIAAGEDAIRDEQVQRLYAAIGTLGKIDRAIVLLYLDDHSYKEIASTTGLSEGNISVRLVRIRKALKEMLTADTP